MFTAIYPATYRGGGILAHGVLKSVSVLKTLYSIPELIALIVVVCIHKWKHSTLLSILLGTITYMFLIQTVF